MMFFNLQGSFAAWSDYSECCLFLPSFYFVTVKQGAMGKMLPANAAL